MSGMASRSTLDAEHLPDLPELRELLAVVERQGLEKPLRKRREKPDYGTRNRIRLLAAPEALLVHADERYLVGVAPGHPALDGRGHDLPRLAPAQAENPLGVLYALRRLQHINRERLEKQREAGALRRPRKFYDLDSVLRTRHARRPGVYLRDELHRVQMPPAPLLEPVVDARQLAALGACRRLLRILHVHVDALPGHIEGHVRHCPFIAKPQKSRVVLIHVHP